MIDLHLHSDRLTDTRKKRVYRAACGDLPDGAFARPLDTDDAYLVWRGQLHGWTPAGYDTARPVISKQVVEVLTPCSVILASRWSDGATGSFVDELKMWYVIGIVVVIVVIGIIITINFNQEQERLREAQEYWLREQQEDWDRSQPDLALSCRKCDSLAAPIVNTGNRYRCEKCGNQFAATKHNQPDRPT